ncbi:hypothetical protein [uncultured Acetatifactor sp.]|uniref:hypothetical protein n=1 Tax=uncultured Acetatifactor sp. TaxID=1671927 RepID=UPI002ED1414C
MLKKGIPERKPALIGRGFDEANLLFGIRGQTLDSMTRDISLGLACFERICVNIMCPNTTQLEPDGHVISVFMDKIYPKYKDDQRADILIQNTDFGVGD